MPIKDEKLILRMPVPITMSDEDFTNQNEES